ncbi:MAG: EthD family reductase [Gammaproteobacteria bacterium]|nr:EthD family reductase [Gammaproteobacteria bacterium]
MIRVIVMYPNKAGGTFNYDYYLKTHMPLVKRLLGAPLKDVRVFKGVGAPGGKPAGFVTMASLFFDDVPTFEKTFGPHAEEIMGDIPNFSNIEPQVQIDERLM